MENHRLTSCYFSFFRKGRFPFSISNISRSNVSLPSSCFRIRGCFGSPLFFFHSRLDRLTPGKIDVQIKGSTECLKSTSAGDPLAIPAANPLIPHGTRSWVPQTQDPSPFTPLSTIVHKDGGGQYSSPSTFAVI